jgi:hypothetical protein
MRGCGTAWFTRGVARLTHGDRHAMIDGWRDLGLPLVEEAPEGA